jgi:hypothetical protein
MKPVIAAALMLLASGAISGAAWAAKPAQDYSHMPADLAKAAKAFDEAQVASDGKALNALVADDYVLVGGAGNVENKKQFVADNTDPDVKMQPFELQDQLVRVWADGAVLGGKVTLHLTDHGKPVATTFRFADIWAKRNGKWQVIYTGVTRTP